MKISIHLQEILIALAFVIVVPITVFWGASFVAPSVQDTTYWQDYSQFMKGYSYQDKERFEAREAAWKKTERYLAWEGKVCQHNFMHLMIKGIASCGAFALGVYIVLPAISASMVTVGLILYAMYNNSYRMCNAYHGIGLFYIELLFVLLSFAVVLWMAKKSSE